MTYAVTGEQIRAARALVRVDQTELARRSGVSLETIKRLERIRGPVNAHIRTVRALLIAFAELGVEVVTGEDRFGVRPREGAHAPVPQADAQPPLLGQAGQPRQPGE